METTINAYAKINLAIDVIRKRKDGYHDVKMIMQQIDLYDTVTLTCTKANDKNREISLTTNHKSLPNDEKNIAFRAAQKILPKEYNLRIHIAKKIPVSAGLAGGSTNAAAVLKGLNELLDLKYKVKDLMNIGLTLGADVPFCLLGGAALAEGIGEKLTTISGINLKILLSTPPIEVLTAKVYNSLVIEKFQKRPQIETLMKNMKNYSKKATAENFSNMTENFINTLENFTLYEYPIVMETRKLMIETGADYVLMSGSGPTIMGFFQEENKNLTDAYKKLKKINPQTYIANTVLGGKDV